MKTAFVVLAAGRGSRFCSDLPKVLQPLAGKPMLLHLLDTIDAVKSAQDVTYVVTHYQHDQVAEAVGTRAQCVLQPAMDGTAGAVAACAHLLGSFDRVLVLYGDVPCVSADTMYKLLATVSSHSACTVLTAVFNDATGYGRIVRDETGQVLRIVEQKDANDTERLITEVNTGLMAFDAHFVCGALDEIGNNNAQQERYLTDIVAVAHGRGHQIHAIIAPDVLEVQGVNNHSQLASLERAYQAAQAERLMAKGVRISDPSRLDVRGLIDVGVDVTIDVGCVFIGDVTLADGVDIGAYSVIENATIGEHTHILPMSMITETTIGARCTIGPYARVRPDTQIGNGCRVGNFVELKNTTLANGSKANHLSYLGDATIGQDTNIGAGTITCNYDGKAKHQTVIGKKSFVGSNSSLVAPIELGDQITVAAGSVVTKSVKQGLVVGRAAQKNIANWKNK